MKKIFFAFLFVVYILTACGQDTRNNPPQTENATGSKVTFIELGSVGCIPCDMMRPIMTDIEKEYAGKVQVVFFDVRTRAGNPYAQIYRIRVIPTQVFLDKDGKEFYRHEGYFPKMDLIMVLQSQGVE